MKSAFILVLFALISAPLLAQEDTDSTYVETTSVNPKGTRASMMYMHEKVGEKKFDQKKWKEVVGDLDYEEEKEKEAKADKKKAADNTPSKFNFSMDPVLLKTISFIVVFCLFAFILYYVAQNTKFKKKSIRKMTPADVAGHVENIEELDIEGLLQQALSAGDLRMAVRIHYLLLLKKLNEVGLIMWKKDKTNRDFLSELYGRNDCYDNVRGLTLAYELVWYGERGVSTESFQRLSGEFESVNRQITQGKPEA